MTRRFQRALIRNLCLTEYNAGRMKAQLDRNNATRREIILHMRHVIIADRRPIAPINAGIFALKLRPPVAGAKPRPTDG